MPIPAINTLLFGSNRGIQRRQFGYSGNASAGVASFTLNNVRAGSQIIFGHVIYDATATVSSVTCTGESNLSARGSILRAGAGVLSDAAIQFYTLDSVTAGGNKTITMTLSGSVNGLCFAWEVNGGDSTAFFEGQATATSNTVNITTANNNSGIFIIGVSAGGQTAQPPYIKDFINIVLQNNSGFYKLNAGTAGTYTANYNGTGNQLIMAASFKAIP